MPEYDEFRDSLQIYMEELLFENHGTFHDRSSLPQGFQACLVEWTFPMLQVDDAIKDSTLHKLEILSLNNCK